MKLALIVTDNREHLRDYANPKPYFGTAPNALLLGFQEMPHLEIHVVSCTRQPMQSPDRLAENIWFHSLHVPRIGWMRTGYFGCIRAVRRKLQQIQPAIVHGQGTEMDCAMDAVYSQFPNVLTLHGNMVDMAAVYRARAGSFHWVAARLENLALRRTRGVFCNSRYTEQRVAPRTRRTWHVPNALRPAFFNCLRRARRNPRCILLQVGAICANKRQREMLAIARSLHEQKFDFELRFIGSADPTDSYVRAFLAEVQACSAHGYARYLGSQSLAELIDSFDEASALVHTPVAEAFGLVVAEALARDMTCFGFSVGGLADIVEGVPGAVLVKTEDWSGLLAALSRWLAQGHPASPSSAPLMLQRYHPTEIARRHEAIYREVLSTLV